MSKCALTSSMHIWFPGALYNIIRVPPEKTEASDTLQGAKVLCSIVPKDKSHPSYYHSFGEFGLCLSFFNAIRLQIPTDVPLMVPGMSENYVVFIEQPIKMDLLKIVTCKLRGRALGEGIYWDPKQETVFHLVDKRTGKVRRERDGSLITFCTVAGSPRLQLWIRIRIRTLHWSPGENSHINALLSSRRAKRGEINNIYKLS